MFIFCASFPAGYFPGVDCSLQMPSALKWINSNMSGVYGSVINDAAPCLHTPKCNMHALFLFSPHFLSDS